MCMPDLPCFLNVRELANSGVSPLVNWLTARPWLSGRGLPCHFFSAGLGSKRSTGLGPPTMNMKMTRLAVGVWCGFFGARGSPLMVPAAAASRASSQDRARPPQPPPACQRKSRREEGDRCESIMAAHARDRARTIERVYPDDGRDVHHSAEEVVRAAHPGFREYPLSGLRYAVLRTQESAVDLFCLEP